MAETKKIYSLTELLALGEAKNVNGVALLSALEEARTSTGKPFVKGVLSDAKEEIPFKEWDVTLEQFNVKNGLADNKPKVVRFSGNLESYQNKPQVVLRGNQTVIVDTTADISAYVKTSYIDAKAMYGTIRSQLGSLITNAELLKVVETFMDKAEEKGALYVPYSPKDHTEKSGWLLHTYNCVSKAVGLKGDPKGEKLVPVADKGIIVAMVICHHANTFLSMKVDENTGAVEENDNLKLVQSGYQNVKYLDRIAEATEGVSEETAILLTEGVAAINGLIPPNSLEALIAKQIVEAELNQHRFYEALKSLKPNELRIVEMCDGTMTTICGR